MKKLYICPATEYSDIQLSPILTTSGVSDSDRDIDYGGVDEDGELEPASRRQNVWDEEEVLEEEEEEGY
jgi:hypothetical protein